MSILYGQQIKLFFLGSIDQTNQTTKNIKPFNEANPEKNNVERFNSNLNSIQNDG